VVRPGTDVTVVALAATVPIALAAADELAAAIADPVRRRVVHTGRRVA